MTKERIAIEREQRQACLTMPNVSNLYNLKRAGITVAVVVAGAVAVKLLPITMTLSAVGGFEGGVELQENYSCFNPSTQKQAILK